MQGGLWKKQLRTSFAKHLTECHKNTICIDFQVHNPKLIQEECFKTYIYHIKTYAQGAQRKKQLILSFVKHRKWWNTICNVFQFYNQKLSLEGCSKPYVYYTKLCTVRSTKEQTDSFFRRALYKENHENIISACFHFYIFQLSQDTCFILSQYGTINRVLYQKRHW